MKILFATSEVEPLVRAGGLAEVSFGLPRALRRLGDDVRLILPCYPQALKAVSGLEELTRLQIGETGDSVRILGGNIAGAGLPILLVDSPRHFERQGGPYASEDGDEWADNAQRFALFCRAVHTLVSTPGQAGWKPEIVHCHDWQTGLLPVLLSTTQEAPATLFTVHNLADQGLFSWEVFHQLRLAGELWNRHGLEHYGNFSFIKGGLAYADRINTVSPTYARDIQTDILGFGFDDVLRRNASRLSGILNGVDYELWDPQSDPHLPVNYGPDNLADKAASKAALQRWVDLDHSPHSVLLVHAGKLLPRRGSDLLLKLAPRLGEMDAQLLVMGRGDPLLEQAFSREACRHPGRVATIIGDDDALMHLLIAGGDILLIPSRFEPCGLGQLHALRYGTVPVAHRTGGLADTIEDAGTSAVPRSGSTGYCYEGSSADELINAVSRALHQYRHNPAQWRLLMRRGMDRDFSWRRSALRYQALYSEVCQMRRS